MSDLKSILRSVSQPPTGQHIPPEKMAQLAEGRGRLGGSERAHLAECSLCRQSLSLLTELAPAPRRPWLWVLSGGMVAVTAALVLWMVPWRTSEYQTRGEAQLGASVTWLLVTAAGAQTLVAGQTVHPQDWLAGRYGNAQGEVRTLTVVATSTSGLYWMFPSTPEGAPLSLATGVNLRLPEDIQVNEFPPGPLRLCAVFDQAPAQVAEQVRSGRCPGAAIEVKVAHD